MEKKIQKVVLTMCVAIMLVAMSATSHAGVITPADVYLSDADTPFVDGSDFFMPWDNTINGNGLSSPLNNGDPIPGAWPTHTVGDDSDDNVPNAGEVLARIGDGGSDISWGNAPEITYELGGLFIVNDLVLWNYAEMWQGGEFHERGMTVMTVSFSTDGVNFGSPVALNPALTPEDGLIDHAAEVLALGGVNATHIRLSDLAGDDGQFGGLAEVRFTGEFQGNPNPELEIDRQTGQMTLTGGMFDDTDFVAYSIISESGSLDSDAWTSIASSDSEWAEFTAVGSTTDLSEGTFGQTTLGSLQTIELGNAWQSSPFEDIAITLKVISPDTGEILNQNVSISYTGDAIEMGDLNIDGAIDLLDWVQFKADLDNDLSELDGLVAYTRGDLDGDGDNDLDDFIQFKQLYEDANGIGSFATMVNDVPEPATMTLLGLGSLALLRRRNCQSVRGVKKMKLTKVFPLFIAVVIVLGISQAGQAAQVIQPTAVQWGDGTDASGNFINTINGAGLFDATIVETGDPVPGVWPQHSLGDSSDANFSRIEDSAGRTGGTTVSLIFQLGATYSVDGLALWNYDERWAGTYYNDRGLTSADVEYSSDGGQTWNTLEAMNFARTADLEAYDAEVQSFTSSATANAIRFNNATNHGGGFTGIGEIRFTGEFASWDNPKLLLEVNETTGNAQLSNAGLPGEIDFYQITSASGA